MKKKILLIVLCVMGVSGVLYLQFGRKAVINNVLTKTNPDGYELSMSITMNSIFVFNREKMAHDLVEQVLDNNFENMKMSYDVHGYPDEMTITVYTNQICKYWGIPAFQFRYDVNSLNGDLFFGDE